MAEIMLKSLDGAHDDILAFVAVLGVSSARAVVARFSLWIAEQPKDYAGDRT